MDFDDFFFFNHICIKCLNDTNKGRVEQLSSREPLAMTHSACGIKSFYKITLGPLTWTLSPGKVGRAHEWLAVNGYVCFCLMVRRVFRGEISAC